VYTLNLRIKKAATSEKTMGYGFNLFEKIWFYSKLTLDAWRIAVVRDDLLIYTSTKGEKFEMNLHKTCMGCHTSRNRFCNQCHDYNDVVPPCWDCHFAPSEVVKGQKSEVGVQPPAQNSLRPGGRSEVIRLNRKGERS